MEALTCHLPWEESASLRSCSTGAAKVRCTEPRLSRVLGRVGPFLQAVRSPQPSTHSSRKHAPRWEAARHCVPSYSGLCVVSFSFPTQARLLRSPWGLQHIPRQPCTPSLGCTSVGLPEKPCSYSHTSHHRAQTALTFMMPLDYHHIPYHLY